jgi:hypothetical protein
MADPKVVSIVTRPGHMPGFTWHDVNLVFKGKHYVVVVGEERDGLAWDTDVRQVDGREVTRRGTIRGELSMAATRAVRARSGYTGASQSELTRRAEEFAHKDVEIGDGIVVKRHPREHRWLIYYKGKAQDVGTSFHGAPGYEKLSAAIEKAKKMHADLVIMHGHSKHERGENPRVSGALGARIKKLVGKK